TRRAARARPRGRGSRMARRRLPAAPGDRAAPRTRARAPHASPPRHAVGQPARPARTAPLRLELRLRGTAGARRRRVRAVDHGRLEKALVGREITLVRIGDPLVLRARVDVERALAHRVFRAVRHRGKFLLFELDRGRIVVNPMLAGVFELADAEAKLTRTTALSLVLDNRKDLRYRDDKRMGKVYVLDDSEGTSSVHGLEALGPEVGVLSWRYNVFAVF